MLKHCSWGHNINIMARESSPEKIQTLFIFWQENILQKVVMTAFADRTVVTIAVSMGDRVDLLLFGFSSKIQYSLFLSN